MKTYFSDYFCQDYHFNVTFLNSLFNRPRSCFCCLQLLLECSQASLLNLLVDKPNIKHCSYPSLGWLPVMRALKQGQLKRLYFPHLRTRPSGDSENTTKLTFGTCSKLKSSGVFPIWQTHYTTGCINSPELVQTCSAQKQILPHCLYCLWHFLN